MVAASLSIAPTTLGAMKKFSEPSVPFPVIVDEFVESWRWPALPFAWRHEPAPEAGAAQPVTIEIRGGASVDGEMLGFDAEGASLKFRSGANGAELPVPFSKMRRLTLATPLKPTAMRRGATAERVPAAAYEREFALQLTEPGKTLTGTTLGHVETNEGLFLFPPTDEEVSVRRAFVPRAAYSGATFGRTARECASDRWVSTREDLLAAIARQQGSAVIPIGEALLELGAVTKKQLDRALAHQPADVPLGEMLVAQGIATRADVDTALARKMGHPLVDLARFPIESHAVQKVPLRLALWSRGLPLTADGHRLVVAVDKPSRLARLRTVKALAGVELVPVLAAKATIVTALTSLAQQGVWTDHVAAMPGYFATTV